MIKLSILIVNWNTTDYLIKCLESIFENPPNVRFEIIVVDNNSKDDISHLKELFPQVRLVKSAYNYGFGAGTNIGFRLSSGEYVMTLNPDTSLDAGTIDKLVQTLEENKDVGIAVPVLKEQTVSKSQYYFFNLFFNSVVLRKFRDFFPASERKKETEPFDVEFLGGTGYICRASALTKDLFFCEDNFLFGEEYYLCRQMLAKNYKIRVVPSACFEHYSGVTFKSDPKRLAMATKLGSSVIWKIRREQWGSVLGIISGSLLFLENVVKWAAAILSSPFTRNNEAQKLRIVSQSKSIVTAYLPMMLNEKKYLAEINEQSELFFNGGQKPANPPIIKEITGWSMPPEQN